MEPALAIDWRDQWSGQTVGIMPPQSVRGSSEKTYAVSDREQWVESSSVLIEGRTGVNAGNIGQSLRVEDIRFRDKPHSAAYSEYQFGRTKAELIAHLTRLKPNLQSPDGAAIMNLFRTSLQQIWNLAGMLPREQMLIVSAVEEAVRHKKWRELTIGQVDVLLRVLSNVNVSAQNSKVELDRAFSAIHRSQIDIYPSAAEDHDTESDDEE